MVRKWRLGGTHTYTILPKCWYFVVVPKTCKGFGKLAEPSPFHWHASWWSWAVNSAQCQGDAGAWGQSRCDVQGELEGVQHPSCFSQEHPGAIPFPRISGRVPMAKEGEEPWLSPGYIEVHGRFQVEQAEGGRMRQDTVCCECDSPIASSLSLFYRINYFHYLTQGVQKQDRDCFHMCGALLKSCMAKAGAINNPSAPVPPTSCASPSSSAAQTPQALGTDYLCFWQPNHRAGICPRGRNEKNTQT